MRCSSRYSDAAFGADRRPRSKFARYLRMQVLSYRSDLIRGNIVYGAFDLTRMAIRAGGIAWKRRWCGDGQRK